MPALTFIALQAHIAAEFWQILSQKKIDEAKLNDDDTAALALYTSASRLEPHTTSARIDLTQESFQITRYFAHHQRKNQRMVC